MRQALLSIDSDLNSSLCVETMFQSVHLTIYASKTARTCTSLRATIPSMVEEDTSTTTVPKMHVLHISGKPFYF